LTAEYTEIAEKPKLSFGEIRLLSDERKVQKHLPQNTQRPRRKTKDFLQTRRALRWKGLQGFWMRKTAL